MRGCAEFFYLRGDFRFLLVEAKVFESFDEFGFPQQVAHHNILQ